MIDGQQFEALLIGLLHRSQLRPRLKAKANRAVQRIRNGHHAFNAGAAAE
jgi:hypothetical protein